MSLMSSLNTGRSGLEAASQELSVVGDNIANANTVGFKASRAVFQDQLAREVVGNGSRQIGLGTRLQSVQRINNQGALLSTNRSTDMAIQGEGMFVVKGNFSGATGTYYTRAGQFSLDKDGFLVNQQGLRIQGYGANPDGSLLSSVGDLQVGAPSSAPLASSSISVRANLDAEAIEPANPWDVTNASTTSNFSTSITVYDSLGADHNIDIYFRKTATPLQWEYYAVTDGGNLAGGTPGVPTEVATGGLVFDNAGRLVSSTPTLNNFNPINAAGPQDLTYNFGSQTSAGGTGVDGLTQNAGPSAASFLSQDGYAAGELAGVTVDGDGRMVGAFTNGRDRVIGQVAIAKFQDPEGLRRLGGNLFSKLLKRGFPLLGRPARVVTVQSPRHT